MSNPSLENIPPRYRPLEASSSGGFSDVFFYHDLNLERDVAIKSIRDVSEVGRLKDEVNALMQLRSKHVVQVYDITPSTNGVFGIVMEYIHGVDLFNIPKKFNNPQSLLKLLWQIASGISDIHNAGIIHRDIKPNNMKVDKEGIVKIFDFGLARNQGPEARTVGFKGTFGFSAPEQFQQHDVEFTSAIDVYAFGATALFLITQNLPKALTSTPPQPLPEGSFSGTFLEEYPDLISLFEQCLSQSAEERPNIDFVTAEISKYLLFNQHQALAIHDNNSHVLNHISRKARLNYGSIGSCELCYDGLSFKMTNVNGEVYVNNIRVTDNYQLHGACVISLGGAHRNSRERKFITFDISNPEVTL